MRAFFRPSGPNRLTDGSRVTADQPVIELKNIHKSYGALEVLKGVSITAERGHVVSLIGSSGSGKSTLLRCANLLEDSQQGDILFKGEPVLWAGSGTTRRPGDARQVLRSARTCPWCSSNSICGRT